MKKGLCTTIAVLCFGLFLVNSFAQTTLGGLTVPVADKRYVKLDGSNASLSLYGLHLPNFATASFPTPPSGEGWTAWDSTLHVLKVWNGSAWAALDLSSYALLDGGNVWGGTQEYTSTAGKRVYITPSTPTVIVENLVGRSTLGVSTLVFGDLTFTGTFAAPTFAGNYTWTLPAKTGTVAMTSDLSATPTLAAVTAAGNTTTDAISTGSITVTGAGQPKVQVADTAVTVTDSASNGDYGVLGKNLLAFRVAGSSGRTITLQPPASIASTSKVVTMQDKDGTMALMGDIPVTPDLATVTTAGATTTNAVTVGDCTSGAAGADGKYVMYSEQGATDYSVSLNPNAAMTSNAAFYYPADEPVSESFLAMGTDGVMDYVAQSLYGPLASANTWTRGQMIDGTADEVQLTVQGNATQTGAIFTVEASGGADVLAVDKYGTTTTGGLTLTGSVMQASGVAVASAGDVINMRPYAGTAKTNTSGTTNTVTIVENYNQTSGTAANTGLRIMKTETAVGSGEQMFIDCWADTTTPTVADRKFSVSNTGAVTAPSISSSPTISSGTSAPATTPTKVGDIFVDTTAKKLYFATGTTNSSDWTIAN